LLLPTSFLQNSLHITMDARGPTIDAFNSGGGRCRKSRQHPPGGSPSTSSTSVVVAVGPAASTHQRACHRRLQLSVVAATGPTASTPQEAHHRHLQLRWWPLLDLSPASPGGPPLTSSTSVVVAVGPVASTPQRARHRRLQLQWWSLPDLPPAPPRRPTIDVSNFGGGRCRTYRQHPPGARD
jgi:hypothetical protein